MRVHNIQATWREKQTCLTMYNGKLSIERISRLSRFLPNAKTIPYQPKWAIANCVHLLTHYGLLFLCVGCAYDDRTVNLCSNLNDNKWACKLNCVAVKIAYVFVVYVSLSPCIVSILPIHNIGWMRMCMFECVVMFCIDIDAACVIEFDPIQFRCVYALVPQFNE